jgi:hypothetical protein
MKKDYLMQSPFTHHVSKWHFQQFIVETNLKAFRGLFPNKYPKGKWLDILRGRVENSNVDDLNNQEPKWSWGFSNYKWSDFL